MSRIFSSNPYIWLLLAVLKVGILIHAFMYVFHNPYVFTILIFFALYIAYFAIPKYMNFTPFLEIKEQHLIYYPTDITLIWSQIDGLSMDADETIHLDYSESENYRKILSLERNQYFGKPERLLKLFSRYFEIQRKSKNLQYENVPDSIKK